ncbi:MAG: hypothetical protein IKD22_05420 [Lentisphaeria bacterium]|nr:hypothetical protein [Lentisphaeria bacterium]
MKKFLVFAACAALSLAASGKELFEKYVNDIDAFMHFRKYVISNPVPEFKEESCPATFNVINVPLKSFTGDKWKVVAEKTHQELRLQYGHNKFAASAEITVDAPGMYKVCVNYLHLKNYVASFAVNLYDSENQKVPLLSHKMDYVPYKNTGMQEFKQRATAWYWENTPMVELLPGKYRIELTGLIHQGPYTWRRIRHIVLTNDPFAEGNMEMVGKTAMPAADLTKQYWDAWHKRPGALPAASLSEKQKLYYRAWLRAYLIEKNK